MIIGALMKMNPNITDNHEKRTTWTISRYAMGFSLILCRENALSYRYGEKHPSLTHSLILLHRCYIKETGDSIYRTNTATKQAKLCKSMQSMQ